MKGNPPQNNRIYLAVLIVAALGLYWHAHQPTNVYIQGPVHLTSDKPLVHSITQFTAPPATESVAAPAVVAAPVAAPVVQSSSEFPPHLLPKNFKSRRVRNTLRLAGFTCQNKGELIKHEPDGLVIEVGAFDGSEAVDMAKFVRKVISYEATPSKIPGIRSKISENGLDSKIELHHAAVTDKDGTVKLYIPGGEGGSQQDSLGSQTFWADNDNYVEVPAVRLDTHIKERVVMLKVDTQGHELGVLRGATGLIEKYGIDMIHLEFWPNGYRSNGFEPVEMLDFLADYGYVCFDCNEFSPPGAFEKRSFEEFSNGFGSFQYGRGDHGAWGDILCIRP